ncbi:unnamed protein product [Rhodiola kirilowii]
MEEESIRFPNLSLNRWIRARRVKNLGGDWVVIEEAK